MSYDRGQHRPYAERAEFTLEDGRVINRRLHVSGGYLPKNVYPVYGTDRLWSEDVVAWINTTLIPYNVREVERSLGCKVVSVSLCEHEAPAIGRRSSPFPPSLPPAADA